MAPSQTPTLRDWVKSQFKSEDAILGLCSTGKTAYIHLLRGIADGKSTAEIYRTAPDHIKGEFHSRSGYPDQSNLDNYYSRLEDLLDHHLNTEEQKAVLPEFKAALRKETARAKKIAEQTYIPVLSWAPGRKKVVVTWVAEKPQGKK